MRRIGVMPQPDRRLRGEAGRKARSGWAGRQERKTTLMSVDQLGKLLSPYRTYDATGPQQLRAVIARQTRSRVSLRVLRSAAEKTCTCS